MNKLGQVVVQIWKGNLVLGTDWLADNDFIDVVKLVPIIVLIKKLYVSILDIYDDFKNIFKGGGRMCHFLKPLKLAQELSQKMSYSCELWYGSCFYDVY